MPSFQTYLSRFTSLPPASMQALLDLFAPITMKKGDHLAVEGEFAKKLAFVESGVLRAYYRATGAVVRRGKSLISCSLPIPPSWGPTLH